MQQYGEEFYLAKPSDAYANKILDLRSRTQGSGKVEDISIVVLGLALAGLVVMLIGVIFKPNVIVVSISISLTLAGLSALVVMIRHSLKATFARLLKTKRILRIHYDLHDQWMTALNAADLPAAYAHKRLTDHDVELLAALSAQYDTHLINREYDATIVQPSLDAVISRLRGELELAHEASIEQLKSRQPNYLLGPLAG